MRNTQIRVLPFLPARRISRPADTSTRGPHYAGCVNASWASSLAARKTMQANRGRDTKPELRVRSIVHAAGYRYRVNSRPEKEIRRTADMVFSRARVAVFIDGCFWHGCPEHYVAPRANKDYWSGKILANRSRDDETDRLLRERGWTVLRIWEHVSPAEAAQLISSTVDTARRLLQQGQTQKIGCHKPPAPASRSARIR